MHKGGLTPIGTMSRGRGRLVWEEGLIPIRIMPSKGAGSASMAGDLHHIEGAEPKGHVH